MSLHKAHIFTVLLIIPLLAACSTAPAKQERLIYMTPSSSAAPLAASPAAASVGASSAASARAESKKSAAESSSKDKSKGSGSSSTGSSKKSAASSVPRQSSTASSASHQSNAGSSGAVKSDQSSDTASRASSGVGSSFGASSAPSSGGAVTLPEESPTINDIVSLYNGATQNNAFLSDVQFCFTNSSINKQTTGTVKFNNDYSRPVFMVTTDQAGSVYYTAVDQSFYFYQGGNWLPAGQNNNVDTTQFVMILDPILSAGDVNACSFTRVGTNRVIDIGLGSGFEKYAEVLKIFNTDEKESIRKVQMEYTLSTDGYIIGAKQVFTLSDGSELSMEKSYLDIGAGVDLTQNT